MSGLTFDPQTGLAAPETSQIRGEIAAKFKAAFFTEGKPELDTDPSAPAGQLVDALVAEVEAKNAEILYLANMFNPKAADGRWQDALGYIYFLNRKMSEPTIAVCRLTGLRGTKIPFGVIAEDTDRRRWIHNRVNVSIGEDGTAETTFRCATTGPEDLGPGAITRIVTTVPGWDTVTNPESGATGRDLETRGDFEARRAGSVAKNAHGSVLSIYGTLHDLAGTAGVIDVQVLENIGPDPVIKHGVTVPGHGVTICIFGGEDSEIAEVIYNKKDAGCDTGGNAEVVYTEPEPTGAVYRFKILRPDAVNFRVKVTLSGADSATPKAVADIKAAVARDFRGEDPMTLNPRVGLASEVFASRFYCPVLNLGYENLSKVEVALGDDGEWGETASIQGDQEPVLSEDNVTVEAV
jgi:uncharacterized phage protein gp47/JayE